MAYGIKWVSVETGKKGKGEPIFSNKRTAQTEADLQNIKYEGFIKHTVYME